MTGLEDLVGREELQPIDDSGYPEDDLDPLLEAFLEDEPAVTSMHDVEEESGDEDAIDDLYSLDYVAAREAGIDLEQPDAQEPRLY